MLIILILCDFKWMFSEIQLIENDASRPIRVFRDKWADKVWILPYAKHIL